MFQLEGFTTYRSKMDSVMQERRAHAEVYLAVLDEVPIVLERLGEQGINGITSKYMDSQVTMDGEVVVVSMRHWYLNYSQPAYTPLWRRFFRREEPLTQVCLWLREDGEIVYNLAYLETNTRRMLTRPHRLVLRAKVELEVILRSLRRL